MKTDKASRGIAEAGKRFLAAAGMVALAIVVAPVAPAVDAPTVSAAVTPLRTAPLSSLPIVEPFVGPPKEARPRLKPAHAVAPANWNDAATAVDPLLARGVNSSVRTPAPSLTIEGQGNTCGCSPPDTIGAVGPNHYVQMVNATSVQIFNKAGASVAGPSQLSLLWPAGGCSTSSNGDPIAVYDGMADRWLLAQFSKGNGVCVAVSQTADPTGAYYGYEFTTPTFPDYFKIGVWPNAYYMSASESTYTALALDRAKMLAGQAATMIRFAPASATNLLMPATVVGPTPPAASDPGIFYTFFDNVRHGGVDRLAFYHFSPDWTTPANSTFTLAQAVPLTSFTYTVCGFFILDCIPQGGTSQRVDPVSEWPMWQLQYRDLGVGGKKLVGNFTVDAGGDRAGIRWFEVTKTGAATYALTQEGTHAPADTLHRWMGSIGIDRSGGIALAYSTSSATAFPSLQHASRAAGDAAGTLQAEGTLFAGTGSQTGSNRWGDYSALTVDPSDDCTFWFTSEYYAVSSGNGWRTRIAKFKLPECTLAPVHLQEFHID